MGTDACSKDKAPFYDIPQENEQRNHPYMISIKNPDSYNSNLEVMPEDPAQAATWTGPYFASEGFWDGSTWTSGQYVWPTYFFTTGSYWQRYVDGETGGSVDDDESEVLQNVTYKALIAIPNDGFGYILDRPRTNINMPDEAPQYGNPIKSYKVKLIDYNSLTPEIRSRLYFADTESYEEITENEQGEEILVTKTRYLNWTPVTAADINEIYANLGKRQGDGKSPEPEAIQPKRMIYYMEPGVSIDKLYEANRYFYKSGADDTTVSFIKDRNAYHTPGTPYYEAEYFKINQTQAELNNKTYAITPQGDSGKYYRANKYYYYDDAQRKYIIDPSAEPTAGRLYCIRHDVYVKDDLGNNFQKGSVWNLNATYVPNTVTLSKRSENDIMKELKSYGRNYNTMNGLILEMNRLIASDKPTTRDRDTLQGSINYLNDIIFKVDSLTPGDFPIIDYFGRLHGAIAVTDEWINIQFDPNVLQPRMIVTHEYNPVTKANTERNMNTTGDPSEITWPIYTFDTTGHKVGSATHKLTLPYSFKHVTGANNLTTVTEAPVTATATLTATACQDTINFIASNKWIGLDTATGKTMKIGHRISPVTIGSYGLAQNETLGASGTLKVNKTFEVPYFTVDEAGHITAAST
jgi:hypothetical protein